MAKCGRRPVLDEVKRGEILVILTVGCSRRTAAKYVGCSVSTIGNTADRDPEFAAKLRHAENQAEVTFMKSINSAAKKAQYWRAAAWALERRNPEDYARRGPDVITVEQISELLSRFADIIVEEVPAARDRKNILRRLEDLTRDLRESPPKQAEDK